MSNDYDDLDVCPVCGKRFIPAAFHIYKAGGTFVCSWGCQRKVEKEREKRELERRRKWKVKTMSAECKRCAHLDTNQAYYPCCYCVDGSNYEEGNHDGVLCNREHKV